jgi:hypothetical protein
MLARMPSEHDVWTPDALHEHMDVDGFLYVVVEEEVDSAIGLVIAEWPRSGPNGSPRFPAGSAELELAVWREDLQRRLSERRIPDTGDEERDSSAIPAETERELRTRPISVGDVFAIQPNQDFSPVPDPEQLRNCEWIGEAIDITADAREAAKAKMYEALTPPLDPEVAAELLDEPEAHSEPELEPPA